MKALLLFVAALAGILVLALTVNKLTGARAYYLDDWKFNPGETVLWRDDAADFAAMTKLGQATFMSGPRLHLFSVVVTSQRILVAEKTVGTRKRMVKYVLYPAPPADGTAARIDGGQLSVGYTSLVYLPGQLEQHLGEKHPFVRLTPAPDQASSTNLRSLDIYSDQASTFRLP